MTLPPGAPPILLDIPELFESERLTIRAPRWGDGPAVNEAIAESLAELRPWMPWAQEAPTVDATEANVRAARLHFLERTDLRLQLVHTASGRFVGGSGLHRIDWAVRKFEIGYWIRTSEAGRGYASEAVAAITAYAARELAAERVEIRCDSRNERSRRVAERNGFTLEGTLRSERVDVSGAPCDALVFAKVRGYEL